MTHYAWIGLGNMGGPMAANLVKAGHQVSGVDLNESACAAAKDAGVRIADSVADAVKDADAVFTMLPKGDHVRSVFGGPDGIWAHARQDALLCDSSTVDVETSRWCHEQSAERGFVFADTPVSGGISGAAEATLCFMIGGEPSAVERASALVEPMSGSVIAAGGPTSGIAAKICNNMMLFIHLMANAEGSQLAEQLGLDPQVFWEIVSVSSGRSWSQQTWYPVPDIIPTAAANQNFTATFSAELAAKDVGLALAAGEQTGVHLPAARMVFEQLQELMAQGLGDRDCSLVAKLATPDGQLRGFDPDAA
ncbi:3-hydroxyisobutyrate dehydrogenase [Micrococcus terreus]|uniref:3-hydroxyisobutyrate dehydrogenase n=1 Tax=Micrococcus terreus TaxID=574650 RepID=UPI00255098DA|nr:3-hydroxyisobutyrate dehydrogenase [Micrococcus terreus]MDK7700710.1 3-hydroxyisobutyrate dehydrogenase [Micrococcus terreus]WOO97352.1 3-hydroxyisobutyrate dehydrogenase [Micrococcus terreus]